MCSSYKAYISQAYILDRQLFILDRRAALTGHAFSQVFRFWPELWRQIGTKSAYNLYGRGEHSILQLPTTSSATKERHWHFRFRELRCEACSCTTNSIVV